MTPETARKRINDMGMDRDEQKAAIRERRRIYVRLRFWLTKKTRGEIRRPSLFPIRVIRTTHFPLGRIEVRSRFVSFAEALGDQPLRVEERSQPPV